MLTVQNSNNLAFNGKLVASYKLKSRINDLGINDLKMVKDALKQMAEIKDGRVYEYTEKSFKSNGIEKQVAYIEEKNGFRESAFRIYEYAFGKGISYKANSGFIKDFICGFVNKYYAEDYCNKVKEDIFKMFA